MVFKIKNFLAFVSLMTLSMVVSYAQPPGGDPPPATVPITGIEWLLLGGGVYGARQIYKRLKKQV